MHLFCSIFHFDKVADVYKYMYIHIYIYNECVHAYMHALILTVLDAQSAFNELHEKNGG